MPDDATNLDKFEAVYYPQQVPHSLKTLTFLGFVFDRIYFPDVYMPPAEKLDEDGLRKEIDRLKTLKPNTVEDAQLINCMIFATITKYVSDFCIFGVHGFNEEASGVAHALEEMVYGPPPPGFMRTVTKTVSKELPGSDPSRVYVSCPGWSHYPAGALLFSVKNQIPLINDNPHLPVPGIPGDAKGNAKVLATILAIESIKLVLPKIKALSPPELKDFRAETATHVRPFRLAMLKLARELNAAIKSEMTLSDVQKEAKFLVETTVYPELMELEKIIHDPGKPWYRRAVDLAKSAPELATNFITMPKSSCQATRRSGEDLS
jgi:hypothetical protein